VSPNAVDSRESWPTVIMQALAWSDKSVVVAPWVMLIVALDRNVVVAIGGSFF
jgi:hypothetical protein